MTEPAPNQSVRLNDEGWDLSPFLSRSAFSSMSAAYPEESAPVGHDPRHDVWLETAPTAFDRSNRDDVERARAEAMVQLAGVVDDHCLRVLLAADLPVASVAAEELEEWVERAALEILLDTRAHAMAEILLDTELDHFVTRRYERDRRRFDLGRSTASVYGMARHGSFAEPFYVVVAEADLLGLSSRIALYLASQTLADAEYLSARCELAYAPRIADGRGAVRIAQVGFAGEAEWRRRVAG